MRAIGPEELRRSVIYSAQVLEELFLKAERSSDLKGMADAAERYHELLNQPLPQGSPKPMPGRGRLQTQREKLDETRAEMMRQAPNLASIVRNLGPWELARVQGRIGAYLRQRVLLRQQRARIRR
jgi:hypothetical protein